ncbi:MAG: alpha/beta hydrolase [Methanocorpusculum sp.]|nr:alpha/beta hydrolase [Methanocorpusculum sp.]
MENVLKVPFRRDCPIIIRGRSSFLLVSKVLDKFPLLIETEDEEIVQGVSIGDLIIVSAPEGGEILPALYLLEMVKTYHTPVIALSKSHPAGRRLSYVVSANEKIEMRCDIKRGTHPEQHLLCSSDEFTGLALYADGKDLIIENPRSVEIEYLDWEIKYSVDKF